MKFTSQSEYLPLDSVLVNPVDHAFKTVKKLRDEWEPLNFTAVPDIKKAREEFSLFATALNHRGITLSYLPPAPGTTIDAIYCRDASIATDHGMILCNMGKAPRSGEPGVHKAYYEKQGIPILGSIITPGTLEGGDVGWLDRTTLAVGYSYRTNESGISQLRNLLQPFGIAVVVVDLPHFKGPADVFHLMSVFSPIGANLAVVFSPLLPIAFRNELLKRGYQFIEVPEKEFESMGCNVLAVNPKCCVMLSGNPLTSGAIREIGIEVLEYRGEEISIKGGGGPTCLTRPLKRRL